MATQVAPRGQEAQQARDRGPLMVVSDRPVSVPVSLSEVLLQDLRVERAHARIFHIRAGWSMPVPALGQPVLYSVLEGGIVLDVSTDEGPVRLETGDGALIFYGDAHELGQGGRRQDCPVHVPQDQQAGTVPRHQVGQGGGGEAVVLQSVLELTYLRKNAHVSRAAPSLIVLRGPTKAPSELRSVRSFPFISQELMDDLEGPGALALASAFANMQLCHALKQWTARLWGESVHDIRHPNMRRVATVVREIRAHPDRAWTVPGLARHVGLSRSAFAQCFQEVIGESPIAFLTRTRMERAATLLRTGSLSMLEVGQRVGYPIETSFARAFKRHFGIAPRNFPGRGK